MAALYLGIILICRVVQAIFNKRSSNGIHGIPMLVGYNAFKNALSAILGLILILITGAKWQMNGLTLVIATFSGVMMFFSGACGIYAMKSGTISLCSMFGTAGMIIPILAGVFLFGQKLAPMQLVGLAVFFAAAWLLVGDSRDSFQNFSYKTLLLLIGSMLAEGSTMLSQQLFTSYVPEGDISVFSFVTFGSIALLSSVFYGFMGKAEAKKALVEEGVTASQNMLTKELIICGIALAAAVFVINQLATLSTKLVPPVILFTVINGGGTIISTVVAAVLYKEKLSRKKVIGVLLGIASLVIIKMFEI